MLGYVEQKVSTTDTARNIEVCGCKIYYGRTKRMKILIEIAVVLLICYGIWHEDALVAFEDKLLYGIKNRFKRAYRRFYGQYIEYLRKDLKK